MSGHPPNTSAHPSAPAEESQSSPGESAPASVPVSRIKGAVTALGDGILAIVQGLWSPDKATRWMSLAFFLSLLLGATVASWGFKRYQIYRAERHANLSEAERIARQAEEVRMRQADDARILSSQILLGTFQIELTLSPGEKKQRGVRYVADLDVVVVCDDQPTREHIQQNLLVARGQVASAIHPIARADLLTRETKAHLKKLIMLKLNAWLPFGKVEEVHFTRLIEN